MMEKRNINSITTREQYDEVRARVNELINEATAKGLLELDAENDFNADLILLNI